MNALPYMDRAAERFCAQFRRQAGCTELNLPCIDVDNSAVEFGIDWRNSLFQTTKFRRAHVETLRVPGRLSVLHVCAFPHLDDTSPIFGFDMVAGPSRVTGIFLDLSSVTVPTSCLRLRDVTSAKESFSTVRQLPPWGKIFSEDVIAIRPSDLEEVQRAIMCAEGALEALAELPRGNAKGDAVPGQAAYIAGQRKNDHTQRMLASFIGAQNAQNFIENVLFPNVVSAA